MLGGLEVSKSKLQTQGRRSSDIQAYRKQEKKSSLQMENYRLDQTEIILLSC